MKVAIIQLNAGEIKKNNITKACSLIEDAASKDAKLVLLPEVFNFRGPLEKRRTDFIEIAENIPGESILPLMKIAEDNDLNIIAGSIYEQSNEGNIFNTSVVIDNFGKIIAKYRKIKLI